MPVMLISNNELYHHGILGQKWGVRRYQNPDGTLTFEGRKRFNLNSKRYYSKYNQQKDRHKYGKGAIKRIAKNIGKGKSLQEAHLLEDKRNYTKRSIEDVVFKTAVSTGGTIVGKLIYNKFANPGREMSSKEIAAYAAAAAGMALITSLHNNSSKNPYKKK